MNENDPTPVPEHPVAPQPQIPLPVVNVQSLTPGTASSHVPVVVMPEAPAPSVPPPSFGAPAPAVAAPQAVYETAVAEPAYYVPASHVVIPAPKKRNPFMAYLHKLGAGSLMLSLAIHAGLIALAVLIVTVTVREPKVDFLPGGGSKGAQAASQEMAHNVQQKKQSKLNKATPMRKVQSTSTNAQISLPDVPMEALDLPETSSLMGGAMASGGFGNSGAGGGFGKGTGIGGQTGFVSLPPSMKSRCSSAERLQKLKEGGVTVECEKAVSTALEYFKTKQKPDGAWGTGNRAGMTGMALLCYLGRCETPDSPFYGENVMKGILYLIELQKKKGVFCETPDVISGAYEQGIATYALGEMYSLARLGGKALPGMREAFEDGVKLIIENQNADGSWGYYTPSISKGSKGASNHDLSVTGWQYQALKSAKLSGLKINGLYPAIDKAVKFMEGLQTKDGGIGGANREAGYNQWHLTGVGVLGLQTLSHGKSAVIKKGIKFAYELHQKEPPVWKTAELYDWYYYAQIFFQNGGPEQKYWNETALPEILANQGKDGSWTSPASSKHSAQGGDKILSTAFCTLMLEVYYRYLKVGDKEQGSIFQR